MTALLSKLTKLPTWPLLQARRGWIGVDVGSRAIKLAQVERDGAGFRLAGRWVIDSEDEPLLKTPAFQDGTFARTTAQVEKVRGMFRGSAATLSLPSSVVEMRSLELPSGSPEELLAMVQDELSADDTAESGERAFDLWHCGDPSHADDVSRLTVVSLQKDVAARVAADLLRTGLHCQVLDAVPCALARAVRMCDPNNASEPAAALDLGYSSAMLAVVVDGRPTFCRAFRGCGLQALMQPLQDKLGVSPAECRQLLRQFGLGGCKEAAGSAAAQATLQIISAPLENLVGELQRTWSFLNQQYRELVPQRVWLFGGGASIRNLPAHLSGRTGVPTQFWQLNGGRSESCDASEALFGGAAALSALAWEAGTCT